MRLWDAWDDDALVADRATGVYLDPKKLRAIDHVGRHFKVKGPVNIGRAPQGRPIVLQAGGSAPGQALAARTADVVFTVTQDIEESKAAYKAVKERMPAFGRAPEQLTMLPGVMPVVGRTDKEAREKLAVLQSFVDSRNGAAAPHRPAGLRHDAVRFRRAGARAAADRVQPDLRPRPARQGAARRPDPARSLQSQRRRARPLGAVRLARDDRRHAASTGSTSAPPTASTSCRRGSTRASTTSSTLVVPILQERGLFRRDYEGTTLRDHLGLARPEQIRAGFVQTSSRLLMILLDGGLPARS